MNFFLVMCHALFASKKHITKFYGKLVSCMWDHVKKEVICENFMLHCMLLFSTKEFKDLNSRRTKIALENQLVKFRNKKSPKITILRVLHFNLPQPISSTYYQNLTCNWITKEFLNFKFQILYKILVIKIIDLTIWIEFKLHNV